MLVPFVGRFQSILQTLTTTRRRKSASALNGIVAAVEGLESRRLLAGSWTQVRANVPGGGAGSMLLLTDGSVMVLGSGVSRTWNKLTPDDTGNYINGTWSSLAPMSLARLGNSSVILPNGKVFILGGEFTGPDGASTSVNTGEIYDPVANRWTPTAPFPQTKFGDGQAVLLPNGKILCGYLFGTETYLYDPAANTWTQTGSKIHAAVSYEETWMLLPGGDVLSYDTIGSPEAGPGSAQRYVSSTGTWIDAGVVPNLLTNEDLLFEMGPAGLLPDGRVIQVGANGRTALYTPSTNTWAAGPTLPDGFGADDSPGAILPNGHFIFLADTPLYKGPTRVFEFDPTNDSLADVTPFGNLGKILRETVAPAVFPAFKGRMLLLPNGHMLMSTGGAAVWEYTPFGFPQPAWAPTITNIVQTASTPVPVFTLTGRQLTGISEGANNGDDAGLSTNFPIVRVRDLTGLVRYARTFNWTPGVATKNQLSTVQFTMPEGFEPDGVYFVSVSANGISSSERKIGNSGMLKDIFVGSSHSNPQFLTDVNGTLFFTSNEGVNGTELWKSNGTAAGTVLVKDIRKGSAGSNPTNLINVNGTLFFSATDLAGGTELWKSDGTANGTVRVADILLGNGGSNPALLTNVNGTLFFQASDGLSGIELWKSNGTAAGTVRVKDIRSGSSSSSPANLTVLNGTLFFVANNGVSGAELWKTDGTTAGTVLVRDIRVGIDTSGPDNLTPFNGKLYFAANNGLTGMELWKSDGTSAGTTLVKDIDTRQLIGSTPTFLTPYKGQLYFQARTATAGAELWSSDGTSAGTSLVKDLNPKYPSSSPSNLFVYNNALYFQATDPAAGNELWKSDGTASGTGLFSDINRTTLNSSYASDFINVLGTLYFKANDGLNGFELWKTDGTVAGTKIAFDIMSGTGSGNPSSMVAVNGQLFFAGNNTLNGNELWMITVTAPAAPAFSSALAASSPVGILSTPTFAETIIEDSRFADRRARHRR